MGAVKVGCQFALGTERLDIPTQGFELFYDAGYDFLRCKGIRNTMREFLPPKWENHPRRRMCTFPLCKPREPHSRTQSETSRPGNPGLIPSIDFFDASPLFLVKSRMARFNRARRHDPF